MLLRASLLLNVSSDAPRNAGSPQSSSRGEAQAAFFTLPAPMHAVQTRTCFLTPATTARTRFRFGFHRRRRVLFAWLITFPKCGALPQNSHFSAIFLPASVFILAWISCSKCHKNQAPHSSRPSTSGKARPFASFASPLSWGGRATCFWMVPGDYVPPGSELPPPPGPVLSYGFPTRAAYQQPLQSY